MPDEFPNKDQMLVLFHDINGKRLPLQERKRKRVELCPAFIGATPKDQARTFMHEYIGHIVADLCDENDVKAYIKYFNAKLESSERVSAFFAQSGDKKRKLAAAWAAAACDALDALSKAGFSASISKSYKHIPAYSKVPRSEPLSLTFDLKPGIYQIRYSWSPWYSGMFDLIKGGVPDATLINGNWLAELKDNTIGKRVELIRVNQLTNGVQISINPPVVYFGDGSWEQLPGTYSYVIQEISPSEPKSKPLLESLTPVDTQ
jgi:hypothetical protein